MTEETKIYTLEEALKAGADFARDMLREIQGDTSDLDTWYDVGFTWDMNVWSDDSGRVRFTLYPKTQNEEGLWITVTDGAHYEVIPTGEQELSEFLHGCADEALKLKEANERAELQKKTDEENYNRGLWDDVVSGITPLFPEVLHPYLMPPKDYEKFNPADRHWISLQIPGVIQIKVTWQRSAEKIGGFDVDELLVPYLEYNYDETANAYKYFVPSLERHGSYERFRLEKLEHAIALGMERFQEFKEKDEEYVRQFQITLQRRAKKSKEIPEPSLADKLIDLLREILSP